MKHRLRLSFPIMECQLTSIETVISGLAEVGRTHDRRARSTLLNMAVVGEYPMAVDLDDKSVRTVDRVSVDRAALLVNVNEVPYSDQHIAWLKTGDDYHLISVVRYAVANCPWFIEMKRF